jgi:polyisoprenoid-binding protein YceI
MIRSAAVLASVLLLAAPAVAQQRLAPVISQNPAAAAAGTYKLDKSHASVVAKAQPHGLEQTTPCASTVSDGELTYDPRNPTRSRVNFTVDPGSVDTGKRASTPSFPAPSS